jgi:hypothetical protein
VKPYITAKVVQDNLVRFPAYSEAYLPFDALCSFEIDKTTSQINITMNQNGTAKIKELLELRLKTALRISDNYFISFWHDEHWLE